VTLNFSLYSSTVWSPAGLRFGFPDMLSPTTSSTRQYGGIENLEPPGTSAQRRISEEGPVRAWLCSLEILRSHAEIYPDAGEIGLY